MSAKGRLSTVVLALVLGVAGTPSGLAHTAGRCVAEVQNDRCENWAHVIDDPSIRPPSRSDQFVVAVAASGERVFVAMKDVAIDPDNPYAATASWLVLAYDAESGERLWEARRAGRTYDVPLDLAVSPDGGRVYVTGAAYDAFPVAATDSRVVTVAFDAAAGSEIWSQQWDNRPDASDNGKVVRVSADGHEVYVGGITTTAAGDLDYLTLAYDARRGRPLWDATYAGPATAGSDALFALGVAPDGAHVFVTGWSDGVTPYDADYATVAYRTGRHKPGSTAWVARYDGVGADRSDRANALTVAPDGSVLVTGDSYAPGTADGTRYDAATVRYAADSGQQLWEARYAGPRNGLDTGVSIAASARDVVVTAQSVGADQDSGHDTASIAYNLTTGAQRWARREDGPRSSEHPRAVSLSPDGSVAYVLASAAPVVPYTSLDEMVLHAYRMGDGSPAWSSRLDDGQGNAVAARAMTVLPDGRVVVAGQVTLSQSPLGPPSQNRYDGIAAIYDPEP